MKVQILLGAVLLSGLSALAAPPGHGDGGAPRHGGGYRQCGGGGPHHGGRRHPGGGSSGVRLAADIVGLVGASLNLLAPRVVTVVEAPAIPVAPVYAVPEPAYAVPVYAKPVCAVPVPAVRPAPVYVAPPLRVYRYPAPRRHAPPRRRWY